MAPILKVTVGNAMLINPTYLNECNKVEIIILITVFIEKKNIVILYISLIYVNSKQEKYLT